jgi:hypothetical protein
LEERRSFLPRLSLLSLLSRLSRLSRLPVILSSFGASFGAPRGYDNAALAVASVAPTSRRVTNNASNISPPPPLPDDEDRPFRSLREDGGHVARALPPFPRMARMGVEARSRAKDANGSTPGDETYICVSSATCGTHRRVNGSMGGQRRGGDGGDIAVRG